MLQNLSSAAVVIGALRVRLDLSKSSTGRFHFNNSSLILKSGKGTFFKDYIFVKIQEMKVHVDLRTLILMNIL